MFRTLWNVAGVTDITDVVDVMVVMAHGLCSDALQNNVDEPRN